MHNYKPRSPMSMLGRRGPKISVASPSLFKSCDTSLKTVCVPHIKYVLTQHPVVVEKIHKEVKYNKVPITREFITRRKPVRVIKMPCSPKQCRSPRRCGMMKMRSPCGMRKMNSPCGMRPRMQQYSPCNKRFNPNVKRDGFPCSRSPNFSHTFLPPAP